MRAPLISIVAVFAMGLSACAQEHADPYEYVETPLYERHTGELLLKGVRDKTASGDITLIDIRTPAEWRMTGVPPGAERADFMDDTFLKDIAAITRGDKLTPIALICRSGNRSSKAKIELKAAGYTNVINVTDGIKGWRAAGLDMEDCNC